jgi:mono/diheme cytochrome c family protein
LSKKLNSIARVSVSLLRVRVGEETFMRRKLSVAAIFALAFTAAGWAADDGAALYKAKCAQCHGSKGEGKSAMKAPPLKGASLQGEQLQQLLMQGEAGKKAPHGKAISGLTAEQAKAIADYVTTLQ